MNCEQTEDRLQALIDGALTAAESIAVEQHIAACARCREIAALMRLPLGDLALAPAPELTRSILERTSGPACGRAEALLGQRVDDALDPFDEELLGVHLDACTACASLATALIRLREDLPALATLSPDAGFVERVLDATSQRPRRLRALAARAAAAWQQLLARPRLAWEAGYVGGMALWVVFALTGSPLPAQALDSARVNPVEVLEDASRPLSQGVRQAWAAANTTGRQSIRDLRVDLAARYGPTGDALLEASSQTFASITTAVHALVRRFVSDDKDNARSPS